MGGELEMSERDIFEQHKRQDECPHNRTGGTRTRTRARTVISKISFVLPIFILYSIILVMTTHHYLMVGEKEHIYNVGEITVLDLELEGRKTLSLNSHDEKKDDGIITEENDLINGDDQGTAISPLLESIEETKDDVWDNEDADTDSRYYNTLSARAVPETAVETEDHDVDPKDITKIEDYDASGQMGLAVTNRQNYIPRQKKHDDDDPDELKVAIENDEKIMPTTTTTTTTTTDNINNIIYRQSSNHLLHQGRVVSELCTRILSRTIAQSTILVVTPDIPAQYFPGNDTTIHYDHQDQQREVDRGDNDVQRRGQIVASRAMEEGHTTVILSPSTNLNSWWNNLENQQQQHTKADLSWILLAYFIPGDIRVEGEGQQQNDQDESIDTLLEASRVSDLLNESTITYIVIQVHSHHIDLVAHDKVDGANMIHVSGLTAAQTLLDANYKIQLLASTHYDSDKKYQPNHHFKSYRDVRRFLKSGASFASKGRGERGKHGSGESNFDALLFATQGLDLAIPSRLSLIDVSKAKQCSFKGPMASGRCDSKLEARAIGASVFIPCKTTDLHITFNAKRSEGVELRFNGRKKKIKKMIKLKKVSLWLGHSDPHSAEAACARFKERVSCATRIIPQPIPKTKIKGLDGKSINAKTLHNRALNHITAPAAAAAAPYNILSILIDPLSRNQLLRSLPNTASILSKLGFVKFGNYTIVGDNSGPNQSALFSGLPLNGRNGIKSSVSHGIDSNATSTNVPKWLWERFNEAGYVTLKGEDVCISNSNMVQSMKPNTTHGKQLYNMFCFDFDRPNCLGKDLAAKYLVQYAKKFMDTYSNLKKGGTLRPFAAFVSFVDSHEDSLTLISYIDALLVDLIQAAPKSNTIIVFLSDHGLHYGPSFASKLGERERAEPMLYVKLPKKLSEQSGHVLRQNADYWTTPFDVYETISDIFFGSSHQHNDNRIGTSLLQLLPESRTECLLTPGIPEKYCKLLVNKLQHSGDVTKNEICTFMPNPPSIFSFYADIPRKNRPSWPKCTKADATTPVNEHDICHVATTAGKWTSCSYLECKMKISTMNRPISPLAAIRCDKHPHLEVDIKIERKRNIIQRHNIRVKEENSRTPGYDPTLMPNILFIEIDSVSMSAAERHFPKTRQLLERHRIIDHTTSNAKHCPTGFCSAIFSKTSVVGQNSIPNQLAALSGCIDRNIPNSDLYLHVEGKRGKTWCPIIQSRTKLKMNTETITMQDKYPKYGKIVSDNLNGTFDIKNRSIKYLNKGVSHENITARSDSSWLFDVVDKLGYVTLFGEEFCYEGSPFVVQGQSFPIDADYSVHKAFCVISSAYKVRNNYTGSAWSIEHDTAKDPKPCIDGKSHQQIAFEYIRGMWDEHLDMPKFAYLNALAAHDYAMDLSYQALGAEAYDELLSEFLEEMLARIDARKTIIVLRSDHGMQGGPSPIDYSAQIEHMNPWNNLIIPDDFPGLSKDTLFSNQDKLNTGFDLYHTLRKILTPRTKKTGRKNSKPIVAVNGIPEWSYNLLGSAIPEERSCLDARILPDLCPCVNERTDMMPYFYVGQSEKLSDMALTNLTFVENKEGRFKPILVPGWDSRLVR